MKKPSGTCVGEKRLSMHLWDWYELVLGGELGDQSLSSSFYVEGSQSMLTCISNHHHIRFSECYVVHNNAVSYDFDKIEPQFCVVFHPFWDYNCVCLVSCAFNSIDRKLFRKWAPILSMMVMLSSLPRTEVISSYFAVFLTIKLLTWEDQGLHLWEGNDTSNALVFICQPRHTDFG